MLSTAWRVVETRGTDPMRLPIIGAIGRYVHLTETTAPQPIATGAHALPATGSKSLKQTPVGAMTGGPPPVGQSLPRSVAPMPKPVACDAARSRTVCASWLMIAVRPPSRAAFDTVL